MSSVHIRISHNNNLIVTEFGYIKIIAVAFRETASESVDHCFDLRVGEDLVYAGLFHI